MNEIANIDPLVGRHYVSKSGNVAEVSRIGPGAIGVKWQRGQSEADEQEFEDWAFTILRSFEGSRTDIQFDVSSVTDRIKHGISEAEAYRRWRKENE